MTLKSFSLGLSILSAAALSHAGSYSFAVKVVGHGKPMILIPGLSCGGDVWNSTVEHYKDHYECHVLTLPGFAGQPSIDAPILPKVRDEIISYIKAKHLHHPIIIGHSLGGTMSLWIAAESPSSVGKVVCVDGAPWLPALQTPTITMASATAQASALRTRMTSGDQAAFAAGNKMSLKYMITAPADVDFVQKTSSLSDPKSVGEAMFELYTTDLRPEMVKVKSPVLMLAEGAFFTTPEIRKSASESYEAQIHDIAHHTVKMSLKARHFIMLDDPEFFFKEIDEFLK